MALQVVIASCRSALDWAAPAVHDHRVEGVIILEQCAEIEADGGAPARGALANGTQLEGSKHGFERILVTPNRGREAHAYLWFIVNRWDILPPLTLFMQGDAPNHVPCLALLSGMSPAACWSSTIDHLTKRPWSFVSLTELVVPSTYTAWKTLATYLELCRRFTTSSPLPQRCHVWAADAFAHFAVSNGTIQRHPRAMYAALLEWFEADALSQHWWGERNFKASGVHGAHAFGATVMERAWSLIFGCTDAIGGARCSFDANTSREAFVGRCMLATRMTAERGRLAVSRAAAAAPIVQPWANRLVRGEAGPFGCVRVHTF